MNKRYLLFIILAFIISSFSIEAQERGCCFTDYPPERACQDDIPSKSCDYEGEIFYPGQSCDSVDDCKLVCCCDGTDPLYIKKKICVDTYQKIEDEIYEILPESCQGICAGTIQVCNENCEVNTQECVSRTGTITASASNPKYYCWDNGEVYTTEAL